MSFFNHHFEVFRSLLSGYTLTRSLMDLEARTFQLSGNVLDVGSKTNQASYYRMINSRHLRLTFSDINPQSDGLIKLDFEKKLSIQDESFDGIIAMNILEHVFNYDLFTSELYRILTPKGVLVGCVPFLIPYHADPNDFFRYTHTSLEKILTNAGFSCVQVHRLGEGGLACCIDLLYTYYPNTNRFTLKLRPLHYFIACVLYLTNSLLYKIGLSQFNNKGGAYLALSFKAYK